MLTSPPFFRWLKRPVGVVRSLVTGWRLKALLLIAIYTTSVSILSQFCLPKARFSIQCERPQAFGGFSPDERMLITTDASPSERNTERAWHIWDTQVGSLLGSFHSFSGSTSKYTFSNDSRFLCLLDDNDRLQILDLPAGNLLSKVSIVQAESDCSFDFCPDESLLVGSRMKGLWHWNWRENRLVRLRDNTIRGVTCPSNAPRPLACVRYMTPTSAFREIGEAVELLNWKTGELIQRIGICTMLIPSGLDCGSVSYGTTSHISPNGRWLLLEVQGEFTIDASLSKFSQPPRFQYCSLSFDLQEGRFRVLPAAKGKIVSVSNDAFERETESGIDIIDFDAKPLLSIPKPNVESRLLNPRNTQGDEARFVRTDLVTDLDRAPFHKSLRAYYDELSEKMNILEGATQSYVIADASGASIARLSVRLQHWTDGMKTHLEFSPSAKLAVVDLDDGSPLLVLDVPWPTNWKRVLPLSLIPTAIVAVLYMAVAGFCRRCFGTRPKT